MLRGAYRETHVTSATRHIPSYNTCSIVPVCICQMMVYGKQTQLGYKKQSKWHITKLSNRTADRAADSRQSNSTPQHTADRAYSIQHTASIYSNSYMHSSSSITVLRGVVYELIFPVLFTHFCDPACRFINPFSVLHPAWQCSQLRVALEERSSEAGMTQCRLVGRALGRWRHGTKANQKASAKSTTE